jgi:hypothetical protein
MMMKKYRLKKLAEQVADYPIPIVFGPNSPFDFAITNKKIEKIKYDPFDNPNTKDVANSEWRFEYPLDNSEWRLQQAKKK